MARVKRGSESGRRARAVQSWTRGICNEWYSRLPLPLTRYAHERHFTLLPGDSRVSSAGSLPTHWLWTDLRVLTNCLAPLSVPVLIELLLLISSWLLQL